MKTSIILIIGFTYGCVALGGWSLAEEVGPSDMRDVLVVLRAGANEEDLDAVLKAFREIGGKPKHIFPPLVFIGKIDESAKEQVYALEGVQFVTFDEVVDPSSLDGLDEWATYAIEAWNNNYMGMAEERGLTPPPDWVPPPPLTHYDVFEVPEELRSGAAYFPMQVSHQWFYRATYPFQPERVDTILVEITGTEEIEGHEYFRFSNGKLLRRDTKDQIICYEEGEERILYKLDVEQWEWWIYSIGPEGEPGSGIRDTTVVSFAGRVLSVAVPAGSLENCLLFVSGVRSGLRVDGPVTQTLLAPGIGMVKFERAYMGDVDTSWELIKVGGGFTSVEMESWGNIKRRFK